MTDVTLTKFLEIEKRLLKPDELASLSIAERLWVEHGSPTDGRALIDVLEMVLGRCVTSGIMNAPILLQRKKALERGTWEPNTIPPTTGTSRGSGGQENGTGMAQCPRCRGGGIVFAPGGRVWLSLPVRLEARKAMSETRPIVPENPDGTEKNKNGTGAKRKIRKPRLAATGTTRTSPSWEGLARIAMSVSRA